MSTKVYLHSVMDTAAKVDCCNETGSLEEGEAYELWHFTDEHGFTRELLVDPALPYGWILRGEKTNTQAKGT